MTVTGKEIYISLGNHEPDKPEVLDTFARGMERYLTITPNGKVVAVLEAADNPASIAAIIGTAIEEGLSPTDAYLRGYFVVRNHHLPSDNEFRRFANSQRSTFADPFMRRELGILDELSLRFSGRVGLIMEGIPDRDLGQMLQQIHRADENRPLRMKQVVLKGNFGKATQFFQSSVKTYAAYSRKRKEWLLQRVIQLIDRDDTAAIALRIGSIHTDIAHDLRSAGYRTVMEFDPIPIIHTFEPEDAMVRRMLLFPGKKITNLEWYQATLAQTLFEALRAINELSNVEVEKDTLGQQVYGIIRQRFQYMNAIQAFENAVKRRGFQNTLREWNILPPNFLQKEDIW